MPFTPATLWMLLATALVGACWVRIGQRPGYRMKPTGGAFSLLVLLLATLLVMSGFFQGDLTAEPRLAVLGALAVLVVGAALVYAPLRTLFRATPLIVLLGAQVFRLPVELALHELWQQGLFPQRATFAGYNFDILIGATAPLMALLAGRKSTAVKWVLVLWNIAGLVLLGFVVTLALLSAPSPFQQFTDEPQNRAVLLWPHVWLPTLLVPTAFILHWYSLQRLLGKRV